MGFCNKHQPNIRISTVQTFFQLILLVVNYAKLPYSYHVIINEITSAHWLSPISRLATKDVR